MASAAPTPGPPNAGEEPFPHRRSQPTDGTKTFVLRYWETEFPMLEPVKSPSGHRLYRREDIETVFEIKRLLYEEGFTIAGARKYLEEPRRRTERARSRMRACADKPALRAARAVPSAPPTSESLLRARIANFCWICTRNFSLS